MHLARADFFITLFEVDLRFRKIDQRGLKTSRIYETLKAFFLQNNFGERVFLRGNFIKSSFFKKPFLNANCPNLAATLFFLELERPLSNN